MPKAETAAAARLAATTGRRRPRAGRGDFEDFIVFPLVDRVRMDRAQLSNAGAPGCEDLVVTSGRRAERTRRDPSRTRPPRSPRSPRARRAARGGAAARAAGRRPG